jgi:lysophospholipase L1-like esterase
MPQIVVDAQSAQIIEDALIVEVRDPDGRLVGLVAKDLLEDFQISKQRLANPGSRLTTDEVLARLTLRATAE